MIIMARQPEVIKIAKSETDKANIAAGKIRNYLALCVYSVRDRDQKAYEDAFEQLVQWTDELDERIRVILAENE